MNGILHYAKANIKKNRGNSITLALLIATVSMLIALGLTLMLQANGIYDKKLDEMNSMHYAFGVSRAEYDPRYEIFFQEDPRVSEYTLQSAVFMSDAHIDIGGGLDLKAVFLNKNEKTNISPLVLAEEDESISPSEAIYVSLYHKFVGYAIGDPYTLIYKNKEYTFTVAGYYEASEMAKTSGGTVKYYLSEEAFMKLRDQIGESLLLMARFSNPSDNVYFSLDFYKTFDIGFESIIKDPRMGIFYEDFKMPNIVPIYSFGGILVGFALVAVLISLLVIDFRVKNSIEDRMINIGILGAAGYTSEDIRLAFLMEYALISLPAALIGAAIPLLITPALNSVLLSMTGLLLQINNIPILNLLSAFAICILLLLMVLVSCRRIRKLPPVIALRGGLATHSFRKNFFPLHKGFSSIDMHLGLKNIFVHGKLYLMVGMIIAGIAFIITFVTMAYINFALDKSPMLKIAGLEISDVNLTLTAHTDAEAFITELEALPEVRKTSMMDMGGAKLDDLNCICYISDDYSKMELFEACEGNLPVWDNEVALPENLAQQYENEIGDWISITKNGISKDYLITGFFSTTNNSGRILALSLAGYRHLAPGYEQQTINVYFNDGVFYDDFVNMVKSKFGMLNVFNIDSEDKFAAAKLRAEEKISAYLEQYAINNVEYAVSYQGEVIMSGSSSAYRIAKITNWREYLETQVGSFSNGMPALLGFIIMVSLLLITLILYMTTKAIIIKRRTDLGILKAGGFQTRQLVMQMAASFIPSALIGSIVGCIAGSLIVNPLFLFVFSSMGGVSRVDLGISPLAILLVCVGIFTVTIAVAILSALRIRHISAYELIAE